MNMRRIRPTRPSPAIVVAILALVAAVSGTAVAGSDVQSAVSKKSVKKTAKKQAKKQVEKATSFAKVDANGGTLAARGVTSTSRTSPGDYLVVFDRDISGCAPVASIREVLGTEFRGLIGTYQPEANTVRVVTLNRNGERRNGNGFNLIVVC
jgi:hypothetical protein